MMKKHKHCKYCGYNYTPVRFHGMMTKHHQLGFCSNICMINKENRELKDSNIILGCELKTLKNKTKKERKLKCQN